MNIIPGYGEGEALAKPPLEKIKATTWECVDECRRIVGYQEDPEWVCPYLGTVEHQLAFKEKHEGQYVGGFLCHACFVKEAADWKKRGIPLPKKADDEFVKIGFVRLVPKDVEAAMQGCESE